MPPTDNDRDSAADVIATRLCEFFIVVTHAILYLHEVYPQRLFSLRNKYGVATFYSRHPDVNSYIASVFADAHAWVEQRCVQSVVIAIISIKSSETLTRYVYDLDFSQDPSNVSANKLTELEAQLRAHLLRLLVTRPHRLDSNGALTFDIVFKTSGVALNENWIPASGAERRAIADARAEPIKDADPSTGSVGLSSRVEFA